MQLSGSLDCTVLSLYSMHDATRPSPIAHGCSPGQYLHSIHDIFETKEVILCPNSQAVCTVKTEIGGLVPYPAVARLPVLQ